MDRLYIVENLDLILEQNNEYFQFREKVILNSKINWELLIEFCTDELEGYLFWMSIEEIKELFLL